MHCAARIGNLFAASASDAAPAPILIQRSQIFRSPLLRFALAAILLVAAGGLVYRAYFRKPANNAIIAHAFLDAMVARHDGCSAAGDHHNIGGDDYARIGQIISGRLGHGVLSCALPGWKFRGAPSAPSMERARVTWFSTAQTATRSLSCPSPAARPSITKGGILKTLKATRWPLWCAAKPSTAWWPKAPRTT